MNQQISLREFGLVEMHFCRTLVSVVQLPKLKGAKDNYLTLSFLADINFVTFNMTHLYEGFKFD